MEPADAALVTGAIKRYYLDCYDRIAAPPNMREREFGYQAVGGGTMIRHLSYADERALRVLLVGTAPSDVYCSNSRYRFPTLSMREKSWSSGDLIFDIDAKDLALPCRAGHGVRVCSECGRVSPAASPTCGACASSKTAVRSLPCPKCIGAAHAEVGKLCAILEDDIGIGGDSIDVYFSGNEGFHVHVDPPEKIAGLGSRERRELADYVMFRGAIPEAYGVPRADGAKRDLPRRDESGWRGRLVSELKTEPVRRASAAGHAEFQKTLAAASEAIGARIDPQVTADIHRIFRLPGSINGKSGLVKIPVSGDRPRPYEEACLIASDSVEVLAESPHRFSLGGRRFGPYSRENAKVPLFAAVYMICKGLATASRA